MTNKKNLEKKILVVEDNEQHISDAKDFFKGVESTSVDYVKTLYEADEKINKKEYYGIISDIFFPIYLNKKPVGKPAFIKEIMDLITDKLTNHLIEDEKKGKTEYQESRDLWLFGNSLPPSGAYVVNRAIKEKIPVAVTTDIKHHGTIAQPITEFICETRVPFFPTFNKKEKDWKKAYESLVKLNQQNLNDCGEIQNDNSI